MEPFGALRLRTRSRAGYCLDEKKPGGKTCKDAKSLHQNNDNDNIEMVKL